MTEQLFALDESTDRESASAGEGAAVGVVIVNWNGWRDTLECLESLFRTRHRPLQVIVCDNQSEDGSLEKIKEWAAGGLQAPVCESNPLRRFLHPPVPKPVSFVEYTREQAERGGDDSVRDIPLVLVRTGGNLGFAGGSNVGLRYLLSRGGFRYAWLLNNDTVVEPETLGELVARTEEEVGAGLCGSKVLYYGQPDRVQALCGGAYNRWLALSSHVGALREAEAPLDPDEVEARTDYVLGASMLLSCEMLRSVGLLNEEYFLYFEELDLAMRARGRFKLVFAPDSVVYHKEGSSIGSGGYSRSKSWTSDYYWVRNRLLFTRRFYPYALPSVYLGLMLTLAKRLRRGEVRRARLILGLMVRPPWTRREATASGSAADARNTKEEGWINHGLRR